MEYLTHKVLWNGISNSHAPQLPNSPDLNINDLSFFRALQACQWDSVKEARVNVE